MNTPLGPYSPIVSALLLGLGIIIAGSIGIVLIWWVRNVLRHRLPKPFLGDGSNVEWAELKRAEIAATESAYDQDKVHVAKHSDRKETDNILATESRGHSIGGNGNHSDKNTPDSLNSITENDLLRSWLSNSGHTDDEWAEKLLGDRESSEEN